MYNELTGKCSSLSGTGRIRTFDLDVRTVLLFQLSYDSKNQLSSQTVGKNSNLYECKIQKMVYATRLPLAPLNATVRV